ncbi:hypothetical protein [Deinococcus multiflagellatus]|uniref:Uncharacterized protein n=1 Tax=Deinococcus multiflagellatus TaxID=1656887 RepID=A0ABW1ZN13_9DEIO
MLSQQTDGIIAVVGAEEATQADIQRLIQSAKHVQAHIAGFVLNRVSQRDTAYYHGYSDTLT